MNSETTVNARNAFEIPEIWRVCVVVGIKRNPALVKSFLEKLGLCVMTGVGVDNNKLGLWPTDKFKKLKSRYVDHVNGLLSDLSAEGAQITFLT